MAPAREALPGDGRKTRVQDVLVAGDKLAYLLKDTRGAAFNPNRKMAGENFAELSPDIAWRQPSCNIVRRVRPPGGFRLWAHFS